MKTKLLFIFIGLISLSTKLIDSERYIGQKKSIENDILWSPTMKLKWGDFQGKIDSTLKSKAVTATNIEINPCGSSKETVVYEFLCSFKKSKSWTKDRESKRLLQHEQLHFDIAEIATRNLRRKVLGYNFKVKQDSMNIIIMRFFNESTLERRMLNEKYDMETKHSILEKEQKKWELLSQLN